MELLNTTYAETIFDIRLTESELGTILVALGLMNYNNLVDGNKAHEQPYKIVSSTDLLDNLTDELADLMP